MKHLDAQLKKRAEKNLYRVRRCLHSPQQVTVTCDQKTYIGFCSTDYLGLANHPKVVQALQQGAAQYGVGSGASALISGHHIAHQQLEDAFCEFLGRERALLFANGYMANLGVLNTLCQKQDVIYQDHSNHTSLLEAGRLSHATSQRYLHNDLDNLAMRLQKQQAGHRYIVSNGVFSAHGDLTPLAALSTLAARHQATVIIDDAHGLGVLGKTGGGVVEHFQQTQAEVPIVIASLGKAFGCYGAIVTGSELLIETLIQYAKSYIYTCAIPPALAAAALQSLRIVQQETWRREKLQALIHFFQHAAQQRQLPFFPSNTPIQSLLVGSAKAAETLCNTLLDAGFLVRSLRPPSVAPGKSIIRITLNALHEHIQIEQLLDLLATHHGNAIS